MERLNDRARVKNGKPLKFQCTVFTNILEQELEMKDRDERVIAKKNLSSTERVHLAKFKIQAASTSVSEMGLTDTLSLSCMLIYVKEQNGSKTKTRFYN